MAMPVASMREYAFGLVKASFHRLHHLLSALSQAIPPSFERKTYKNLIQNKKVIVIPYFVRVLLHNYSSKKRNQLVSPSLLGRSGEAIIQLLQGFTDCAKHPEYQCVVCF